MFPRCRYGALGSWADLVTKRWLTNGLATGKIDFKGRQLSVIAGSEGQSYYVVGFAITTLPAGGGFPAGDRLRGWNLAQFLMRSTTKT
jgi:hypothetical protein